MDVVDAADGDGAEKNVADEEDVGYTLSAESDVVASLAACNATAAVVTAGEADSRVNPLSSDVLELYELVSTVCREKGCSVCVSCSAVSHSDVIDVDRLNTCEVTDVDLLRTAEAVMAAFSAAAVIARPRLELLLSCELLEVSEFLDEDFDSFPFFFLFSSGTGSPSSGQVAGASSVFVGELCLLFDCD